ncbi:hypothetical protein [Streptomyces hypolithicus]
MSRRSMAAGAAATALWALSACGSTPEPCRLVDVVPRLGVVWQAKALPYGADSTYRLCAGKLCESGTPQVYREQVRVTLPLPEGYDERRPAVRLELSGPRDAPELVATGTVTLRPVREGCDQALTGSLRLTADGALEEPERS